MARRVGQTDRGEVTRRDLGRVRDALERHALGLAAAGMGVLLLGLFYYPVGIVLAEAVTVEGNLSAAMLRSVLGSEFYFGWLATLAAAPVDALRSLPSASFGIFGFTAYQAVLSTLASVALGLPGAYVLARFEFPGRRTVRSLTALPFVMPSIVVAIGFFATFGNEGSVNAVIRALGLEPLSMMFSLEIIVLAHAFYNAPLVARLTAAAWESVDARLVETARSLGANPRRAFVHVVVPQLLPSILTAALLAFVFSFMSFAIVLALGGFRMATVEVWVYHSVALLDYREAAALAAIETGVSLVLTYAYLRYEARQRTTRRAVRPPERKSLFGRPTPGRLLAAGYALVALVVFVGPMASMVATSVTGPDGFTLQNYAFLVHRQATAYSFQVKPLDAVVNSLAFGAGSLALAVPMGVVLAILSTRSFEGRKLVDALAMAPFAVSGVVVGLGLLRGLVFGTSVGGHRVRVVGAFAIVAAHAVGAYPFVTRSVAPMLGSLDRTVVESARSLGASRVRTLLDVELPLVASGILAGAAFAFAISIGEFDSTVVLATGSDSYTMPVAIQRYMGRRLGPATAMGSVLLFVTGASFVVIDRFGEVWSRG